MALDEELRELGHKEYEINTYTIKYDSKSKRFFKGFAPKVATGAGISAGVFAGLGVLTLATGGIAGLGVGAIAGISVGVGTAIQAGTMGIIHARNTSQRRFNALGIGGTTDEVGTIEVIESMEKKAYEYSQLLEAYPNQDKFTLEDGAEYSRRRIKKIIKEKEDIAYHGLKYILKQGIVASQSVDALKKKPHLTDYETELVAKYWNVLDRIGECAKNITSKRLDFNPYKTLIIDAIQKGCLLGSPSQNAQIRAVKASNSKDKATEMYSVMYEQPLLEKVREERQEQIDQQELLKEEYKNLKDVRKQLVKDDGKLDGISEENKELAKQNQLLMECMGLIRAGLSMYESLPDEKETDKKSLLIAINKLKQSIEANDNAKIGVNMVKLADKLKATLEILATVLSKEDIALLEANVAKIQARYERSVKSRIDQREVNKRLRNEFNETKAELVDIEEQLELAQATAFEINEQAKTTKAKNVVLNNMLAQKEAEVDALESEVELLLDESYDNANKNKKLTADLSKRKAKNKRATRLITLLIKDGDTKDAEVARLTEERDLAGVFLDAEMDKNDKLQHDLGIATEEMLANKELAEKEQAEKTRLKTKLRTSARRKKKIEKQEQQIAEMDDEITTLVDAQGKNIATISELEVENEVLREQSGVSVELAEQLAYGTYKLEKELRAVTQERDDYRQGVEDLEEELKLRDEVIENLNLLIDVQKGFNDLQDYNFAFGKAYKILNDVIDKVDAHIEYTKEMQDGTYDKNAIRYLEHFIMDLRTRNPQSMTIEDVETATKLFRAVYGAQKGKLQKVSDKKLRELVGEMKERHSGKTK